MALSNEHFLMSCINHSNNGSIDWAKVQEECGFNTKNAAAMRLHRLKKKLGPIGSASEGETAATDGEETPKSKGGNKTPKSTPAKNDGSAKKRKLDSVSGDDEEDNREVKVKPEPED